jgi:ubiquinone/menaquinone biosynthesis C-methylase UbiE
MSNNTIALKQLFNKLAKHYYLIDFLSFGFSNYLRMIAIKDGFTSAHLKVMDLMCGSGNNFTILKKNKFLFESYKGFDISTNMINIAKRKFGLKKEALFFEGDLLNEETNNITGDYIICTYGLKCVAQDEYDNFVTLLCSSLNKNGNFVLLDVQLPTSSFFRHLVIFYISTICKFISIITTGNTDAVKALLSILAVPINLEKLKFLFAEKGFDVIINKKYNDAVLIIKGKANVFSYNLVS